MIFARLKTEMIYVGKKKREVLGERVPGLTSRRRLFRGGTGGCSAGGQRLIRLLWHGLRTMPSLPTEDPCCGMVSGPCHRCRRKVSETRGVIAGFRETC